MQFLSVTENCVCPLKHSTQFIINQVATLHKGTLSSTAAQFLCGHRSCFTKPLLTALSGQQAEQVALSPWRPQPRGSSFVYKPTIAVKQKKGGQVHSRRWQKISAISQWLAKGEDESFTKYLLSITVKFPKGNGSHFSLASGRFLQQKCKHKELPIITGIMWGSESRGSEEDKRKFFKATGTVYSQSKAFLDQL